MFEGNYENIDIAYKLLAAMGLYEGGDTKIDKITVTGKVDASQENISEETNQPGDDSSEVSEESSEDSSEEESSEQEIVEESSEESSEEAAE